jgi:hypothetical protein
MGLRETEVLTLLRELSRYGGTFVKRQDLKARVRRAFFYGGESAPAVVDALSRLICAGRDRMTGCAMGSGAAL